jgi:hypothetical protein
MAAGPADRSEAGAAGPGLFRHGPVGVTERDITLAQPGGLGFFR